MSKNVESEDCANSPRRAKRPQSGANAPKVGPTSPKRAKRPQKGPNVPEWADRLRSVQGPSGALYTAKLLVLG